MSKYEKGNYHLGKNGLPQKCRAKIKCPLGGMTEHFNSINEAYQVVDKLNERLEKAEGFGFAKIGNNIAVNEEVKKAAVHLNNLRVTMHKLENIKKRARFNILEHLSSLNVSKATVAGTVLTQVNGSTRRTIDVEKLKADRKYNQYLKESQVKEFIGFAEEEDIKSVEYRRIYETASGNVINIDMSIDNNGNIQATEETKEQIRKLAQYEKALERAQELEKQIKEQLMEQMKNNNINSVRLGDTELIYSPEHTRLIVDSQKLKNDNIYDEYSKVYQTANSLRVKFAE